MNGNMLSTDCTQGFQRLTLHFKLSPQSGVRGAARNAGARGRAAASDCDSLAEARSSGGWDVRIAAASSMDIKVARGETCGRRPFQSYGLVSVTLMPNPTTHSRT